jgi:hypothetical protein
MCMIFAVSMHGAILMVLPCTANEHFPRLSSVCKGSLHVQDNALTFASAALYSQSSSKRTLVNSSGLKHAGGQSTIQQSISADFAVQCGTLP